MERKAKGFMNLKLLDFELSIHRLEPVAELPTALREESFYSVMATDLEMTVVCRSAVGLESQQVQTGWRSFRVDGSLDFSLTGVLAGLTHVLAEANISIFALSSFTTDYVLVRQDDLPRARKALESAGYRFVK